MGDLARWLGEQLDEDERIALAAADELEGLELGGSWSYDGHYVETVSERTMVAVGSQDFMTPGVGQHIAVHDPARVLREIDAKRQLLKLHAPSDLGTWVGDDEDETPACRTCGNLTARFPCRTLRLLALPYADRPGYREEWAP